MKFIREQENGTKVEIQIDDHSTLDEALEGFQQFLRACGYVIEYNEVVTIVDMDK